MTFADSLPRPASGRDLVGVERHLHGFTPDKLWRWSKALANVRAGVSDARILCIGDSTTRGGQSAPVSVEWFDAGYPSFLAHELDGIEGAGIISQYTTGVGDTRWALSGFTLGATAHVGFYAGVANNRGYLTTTSAVASTASFTPGVECDLFDVYYIAYNASGGFTAQATGGTPVNVPAGGAVANGEVRRITVEAGSVSAANQVTISTSEANVYLVMVEPWNSTRRQVRVANAGVAGSRSQGWVTQGLGYTGFSTRSCIKAYAPHLTVIDLGINDAGNSVPTATLQANLSTLITDCLVSGDVILKTMAPSGNAAYAALEDEYVPMIKGLGFPVVDAYSAINDSGGYAGWNTAGFYVDTLHPQWQSYAIQAGWVQHALAAT